MTPDEVHLFKEERARIFKNWDTRRGSNGDSQGRILNGNKCLSVNEARRKLSVKCSGSSLTEYCDIGIQACTMNTTVLLKKVRKYRP